MLDFVIGLLAPHRCYGCRREGTPLCEPCRESVVTNDMLHCVSCRVPTAEQALCRRCLKNSSFDALYVAGSYEAELERLIYGYKFERARSAHAVVATLLDGVLPYVDEAVIVPLPTASSHIRVRGYDHTHLIARRLGALRSLRVERALSRRHNLRQLGASRKVRAEQAKTAYALKKTPDASVVILLDDVITSGASLMASAELLRDSGAKHIIGLVAAQQTL